MADFIRSTTRLMGSQTCTLRGEGSGKIEWDRIRIEVADKPDHGKSAFPAARDSAIATAIGASKRTLPCPSAECELELAWTLLSKTKAGKMRLLKARTP